MTIPEDNPQERANTKREVRRAVGALFEPKLMIELRAFKQRQVASGYFNDHEALVEAAVELNDQRYQVFVTINPVNPTLLARANNVIVHWPTATTADHDIVRRRWLLIDVDPVRAADTSSTDEEKQAAYLKAKEVRDYLRGEEWPEPVIADSGNGFHLLYRVDLPNDHESRERVKGVLEALALWFDDDRVRIDTGVHNAARIVRFYGTVNRKGARTPERRHRRSKISKVPKEV